jgi:hypothetical protein
LSVIFVPLRKVESLAKSVVSGKRTHSQCEVVDTVNGSYKFLFRPSYATDIRALFSGFDVNGNKRPSLSQPEPDCMNGAMSNGS